MPPVGMGHRRRAVGSGILWQYDASGATAGTASLTGTGLTLTRASVATVQTSASTMQAGIAADTPRIFYDGAARGLLIEEARTQYVGKSLVLSDAAWTFGTGTVTNVATVGPDGVNTVQRVQAPSGGYSSFQVRTPGAGLAVMSQWIREAAAAGNCGLSLDRSSDAKMLVAAAPAAWARKSLPALECTSANPSILPADGRDLSLRGGAVAGARDCLATRVQLEHGGFATSDIDNTGTSAVTRAADSLYHGAFSSLLNNGRLSICFSLFMLSNWDKNATISNTMQLFSGGGWSSHVYTGTVGNPARILYAGNSGAFYDMGSLPTWVPGDKLEIFLSMGGGTVLTKLYYRLNGASVTNGDLSRQHPTIAPSSETLYLLGDPAAANQFTSILNKLVVYNSATQPSWVP